MTIYLGQGRLSKFEVLEEITLKDKKIFLQKVCNLCISKGQKKEKQIFGRYDKGLKAVKLQKKQNIVLNFSLKQRTKEWTRQKKDGQ